VLITAQIPPVPRSPGRLPRRSKIWLDIHFDLWLAVLKSISLTLEPDNS
jgi:hypothetical protein